MESSGPTLRVLIVTKSDGVGGIERNLSWFVPSLRERGIDCDLVVLQPAVGGPELLVDLDPVLLSGGGAGARSMIRRLWALRSLARDYDVVIGTGPVANQLVCLAAARAHRIVAEQNDPFIDRRQRWNRRWGWVLRRADAVVVHTRELAEEVRAAGNYPAKVAVIPNAVDPSACAVAPSPERRPVVCGIGRLVPQKGFADLVRAFSAVGADADEWSLLLVGDGPERAALERLANDLGLGDRLTVTGMVADPWRAVDTAAVFVLPSHHEGFGNVILEAAAAGCVLLVSDCRFGPREIVRHERDGLVFRAGDVDELTALLRRLMTDVDLRRKLAAAGRERLADYSVERVVDDWIEVLGPSPSDDSPRSGPLHS